MTAMIMNMMIVQFCSSANARLIGLKVAKAAKNDPGFHFTSDNVKRKTLFHKKTLSYSLSTIQVWDHIWIKIVKVREKKSFHKKMFIGCTGKFTQKPFFPNYATPFIWSRWRIVKISIFVINFKSFFILDAFCCFSPKWYRVFLLQFLF